ncbi:MAG: hypothetical protein J5643_06545 [Lachnospiraceae bacterium]|nr:hypothetical protein [Lachnospiraceae bacterium]
MAMLLTTTSKINALKEFMKDGDYDAAVEVAEKIKPEKVSSVRDLTTIANAFLKKKRYEDAKDIYIEMHNHAQTHKVLVGLIELCLKTNSPEEAEIYIREFRKLEPDNPERLIYRYRVDVMLGKGPEYLVRSLSKLKDEDYSETWGLELAKAYYKMEEYDKCAQECKDILLWFAGTDAASKAHVLLNACAEKGAKVSMPAPKAKVQEPAPAVEEPVQEEPAEEESEEKEDEGFFDLSAAIGEVVTETIEEDAKAEEETPAEEVPYDLGAFADTEEESESSYDDADLEAVEDIKFSFAGLDDAESDELVDEEAVVDINIPEAAEDESAAEAAEEAADDISVPEAADEAAEEISVPEASEETAEESYDTFFEEEDKPAAAETAVAVVETAAETAEAEAEEDILPEDVTVDIDIIALAIKKAKEADDDDDDVVLTDYYSEEELKEAEWEEAVAAAEKKSKSSAVSANKSFYIPPLKYNTPESILSGSDKASKSDKNDGIPTISAPGASDDVLLNDPFDRVPETAQSVVKNNAKSTSKNEDDFLKGVSASVDNILSVDSEEEDGQMSFFGNFHDDVELKSAKTEDDSDFFDLEGSIADTVNEDIESGEKEPEVSAAPTKRFAEDFTAQALDAALRDDDDAIERALYGLLSEK